DDFGRLSRRPPLARRGRSGGRPRPEPGRWSGPEDLGYALRRVYGGV
ncbi:MAG: hypothetical protein AVDCRST_MAG39-2695, partial [uncultured Sphingomonadaceae bacterium]